MQLSARYVQPVSLFLSIIISSADLNARVQPNEIRESLVELNVRQSRSVNITDHSALVSQIRGGRY
jgi:hypothetical protein